MRPEHWLYTIPLRLRSLFRWTQADQEVDDELRDHLERKTEEYVAQGMTQEEAHRRARNARFLLHSKHQTHGLNEGSTCRSHRNRVGARRGGRWHTRTCQAHQLRAPGRVVANAQGV